MPSDGRSTAKLEHSSSVPEVELPELRLEDRKERRARLEILETAVCALFVLSSPAPMSEVDSEEEVEDTKGSSQPWAQEKAEQGKTEGPGHSGEPRQ